MAKHNNDRSPEGSGEAPAASVPSMQIDTRLSKEESESHTDREVTDREITADRQLTDQDRLDEFRRSFYQSSLPDLPDIPNYHVCWLTTTNPRDPIHNRIRLGYTPILASEVPGWDTYAEKNGEYAGCISVNEMLAFKLPDRLYQMYMAHSHHDEPMNQEGKLRAVIDVIAENASRAKGKVIEEEGTAELGKFRPKQPRFA